MTTPSLIEDAVCRFTGANRADIGKDLGHEELKFARKLIFTLLKDLMGFKGSHIANLYGWSQQNVGYAIKVTKRRIKTDPRFSHNYQKLIEECTR